MAKICCKNILLLQYSNYVIAFIPSLESNGGYGFSPNKNQLMLSLRAI